MSLLKGRPISPGYAVGQAFVYGADTIDIPRYRLSPDKVEAECCRFYNAISQAKKELERVKAYVHAEVGEEEAEIFSAHIALLNDPKYITRVEEYVRSQQINVEQAVEKTVTELAEMLARMDNDYLREREQDIRDIGKRILRYLIRHPGFPMSNLPPQSIVIARELLPSDLLGIDREHTVGIVTEQGGEASHVAILGRSLGIPLVTGIKGLTQRIKTGTRLLVDGQTGEVWIDPTPQEIEGFMQHKQYYDHVSLLTVAEESRECITQDGVRIHLLANIGRPHEAAQVERHQLEGVGLFRTEYMCLDEMTPPSFDRQFEVYKQTIQILGPRPIVIRTFDLGGDKQPAFLSHHFELNPNLGMRGLRFSLSAAIDLFRTQLRALLQAASLSPLLKIIFPMVMGVADFKQALNILNEEAKVMKIEKIPPVGALVETPAAVFTIEGILNLADFVSLGTNDLTQFILAADRNALEVIEDYSVLHPAVLRAIRQVVEVADRKMRPVSVCGEAAADPWIACLLVGLGIRELSMSPVSSSRVRHALRHVSYRELERLAQEALASESAQDVHKLIAGLAARHPLEEHEEK